MTVHTSFGSGQIVDKSTVRGRTQYKVAGFGFEVWLDETDPAFRFASDVDFEPSDHTWDNSTTLPYDWKGRRDKNPTEMFSTEGTISPDHETIDSDDITDSTDSVSGESREDDHEYPGPAPHLFAKQAAGWQPPHHVEYDPDFDDFEEYGHHAPDGYDPFDQGRHAWTFHDDEPDHEAQEEERWHEYNQHALDSAHVANSYTIPEHLQAKPGEPSWQDHVNADMGRVQDSVDRDTRRPDHPDHLGYVKPAGLSDKYADIRPAPYNLSDPVQSFKHDPHAAIVRHAAMDRDAGLDEGVGQEMDLLPSKQASILKSAAWKDVRKKAVRIMKDGGVHVHAVDHDAIYASVDGDHGEYEVMILNGSAYPAGGFSGGKRAIANWKCSCEWGKWAFKRQMTFVGRLCSHGYATYLTQQSHSAKKDKSHPFRSKQKKSAILDEFKSWVKDENGDHLDWGAADNFLSSREEAVSREDAAKVMDYISDHHSERPERDYDQDDYNLDPEEAYKTADVLHHQPGKLTPHLYEVNTDDPLHEFVDVEEDERKTTGPDQIQARKLAKGESDINEHHPAFAWHVDGQDDMPKQGIVHFSSLRYVADEDLLNRLRQLSETGPAEHPQHAEEHNKEVSNVVDELHDRGFAAAPLVAMKKAALRKVAEPGGLDDDTTGGPQAEPLASFPNPFGGGDDHTTTPAPGGDASGLSSLLPFGKAGPGSGAADSGAAGVLNAIQGKPPAAPPAGGPQTTNSTSPAGSPGDVHGGGAVGGASSDFNTKGSHPGDASGPVNPAGYSGGGYQGAGFQSNGDWLKSNETTPIHPGTPYSVKPGDTASDIGARGGGTAVDHETGKAMGDLINPGQKADVIPTGQTNVPGTSTHTDNNSSFFTHVSDGTGNAGGAAPGVKGVGPGKTSSQRFAELYFTAEDEDSSSDDKKNVSAPNMPGTPGGQGGPYKDVAPPASQINQPRPTSGPTTNAQGMPLTGPGVPGTGTTPMTDVHGTSNPLGAPGAGTTSVSGPKGTDSTTSGNPGTEQKKPGEGAAGGMGGGGLGGALNTALGIAEPLIGEVGSGLASGIGGLASGLGGALTKLLSHDPQRFAAQYFQAGGDFESPGGPDWMDYPFAGSGPDRQDWSTTSEDYVKEHQQKYRQETWITDNKGDVTKYTDRPKQKKANGDMAGSGDAGFGSTGGVAGGTLAPSGSGQGLGGSFTNAESQGSPGATMGTLTNTAAVSESSRQFWADAFHPGEQGYFNPHNPNFPTHEQHQQPGVPKQKHPGQPEEDAEGGVEEAADALPELSSAAAGLAVASLHDDSDIVRQFQAQMGKGFLDSKSGGVSDDGIAKAAQRMLRTAGRNYSPAEQRTLEEEWHPKGARNLGDLDLSGTHYVD